MRRVVDAQLREMVGTVDSLVPAIANLAPVADSLWRALQRPLALDSLSSVWLSMRPERVSLAPIAGSGGTVRTGLVITAQPQVVLGAAPAGAVAHSAADDRRRPPACASRSTTLPFAESSSARSRSRTDAGAEGIACTRNVGEPATRSPASSLYGKLWARSLVGRPATHAAPRPKRRSSTGCATRSRGRRMTK